LNGSRTGYVAHYDTQSGTRAAVEALREEGFEDLEVYSPVPAPELEEALGIESSPVRRWALLGGMIGFLTGLLLTSGTSLAYPLVTQGKPIVAMPPFIVIMFELTILLTGIFTLVGMLVHARKPRVKLDPGYRAAFSVDRWGVHLRVPEADGPRAREALEGTDPVQIDEEGER